jgi:hypothetical protein
MKNKHFNFYSQDIPNYLLKNKVYNNQGEVVNNNLRKLSYKRAVVSAIYDEKENTLTFGVSLCSKKDQFVRKEGRQIANTRCVSNALMKIELDENLSMKDINKAFVQQAKSIVEELGLPTKARNEVKLEIVR